MKHFIIKVSIFFAILLCYFGINSSINYYFVANETIPIKNKRILIAGHSAIERGLNPKCFTSAQNIAQNAEFYILTFWKLKRIFKTYTPDTLIVTFAPYDITEYSKSRFSTSEFSGEMFERSYTLENFKEIYNKIPVDYSKFYMTVFKEMAFYPHKNHVKFIGEFHSSTESNISNWKRYVDMHYFSNKKKIGISNVAISHLDSIINLCNSKKITLVLVSTPTHKKYFEKIPKPILNTYLELRKKYKEEYLVIDKTRDIYPDSLFYDAGHLNEYGANRFTNEVIKEIKKAQTHK